LFEKFTVIPSIDLKDGQVVRLLRGDMNRATVYGADPGETARRFDQAGAELIHIVDLDGAIAGEPRDCAQSRRYGRHSPPAPTASRLDRQRSSILDWSVTLVRSSLRKFSDRSIFATAN
jgi:uncharacterized protein related to proFAR isomerase